MQTPVTQLARSAAYCLTATALSIGLSACGGSENAGRPLFPVATGNNPAPPPPPPPSPPSPPSPPAASPLPEGPSSSFAQQCAPNNSLAASSLRNASLRKEQQWLRAVMDEAYLWPADVPNPDPNRFRDGTPQQAMEAYFEALLSPAVTSTGQRRDRFSFTIPTADWEAITVRGESLSMGIEWKTGARLPPRNIRVKYVEPRSAAEAAGVVRGDLLLDADGVSADATSSADVDRLNAALFPTNSAQTYSFRLRSPAGVEKTVRLSATTLQRDPVPQATSLLLPDGRSVGYLLFKDHVLPAEARLQAAMQRFAGQRISELVIDLRYNGGGFLFLASQLATMVSSPTQIAGRPFETLNFNPRRSAENERTDFRTRACLPGADFRCTSQDPLPFLSLRRVYVLSTPSTCSASESLINGLRGIDVEVVLIGDKTCGKPYGFTAKDNCGLSYLPIEFEGRNAKGFGDYADGFEPSPTDNNGRQVKGCSQADDLSRNLGDPSEAMLATALHHASTGSCLPSRPASSLDLVRKAQAWVEAAPLRVPKDPVRENRFLLPR